MKKSTIALILGAIALILPVFFIPAVIFGYYGMKEEDDNISTLAFWFSMVIPLFLITCFVIGFIFGLFLVFG